MTEEEYLKRERAAAIVDNPDRWLREELKITREVEGDDTGTGYCAVDRSESDGFAAC